MLAVSLSYLNISKDSPSLMYIEDSLNTQTDLFFLIFYVIPLNINVAGIPQSCTQFVLIVLAGIIYL